ncbi:rare lipoprotein A [Melioribacter roseus P3M-2]|uniref:Probable endolytic peptidoglycan transglycosylase RlpA n=1 Tax=Melioribacter roseus (strain DSM 23840 / JCM 17771 / VKM B-2668 / P3M-2) TaxID=1191523 RepID=I6ZQX8_MELRP|nr:septal ring lytic transglycosylase RlpA family protein [Melioribacter roseus]AFN74459.1 rare lipoprotein A [Melioribacter roseus P3M-2]
MRIIKTTLIITTAALVIGLVDIGSSSASVNDEDSKVILSIDSSPTIADVEYEPVGNWVASWYGPGFHGRLTANGEIYDQMALTAAHKELPFGTYLRVTNLRNGKSVVVKINDRGPYIEGRDIDLSKGAATALGMIHPGVIKVRIEKLKPSEEVLPVYALN